MDKENKNIALATIIGFCLISMLIAFADFMIIFIIQFTYLANTWALIIALICAFAIMINLGIVSIKEFSGKKVLKNKLKCTLLIITIIFIVVMIVFNIVFVLSARYNPTSLHNII